MSRNKILLSAAYMVMLAYILMANSCASETYAQGGRLYEAHCENCHMKDGTGLAKLIPPLANSDYLNSNQEIIPCIIRHGQKGEVLVNGIMYNQEMEGNKYTDIQINNIINYINTSWGNKIKPVTILETKKRLENCEITN